MAYRIETTAVDDMYDLNGETPAGNPVCQLPNPQDGDQVQIRPDARFGRTPWIPRFWWYLTPEDTVQGPFAWEQMSGWYLQGWFPPDQRIRPDGFREFYELRELFPDNIAFVSALALPLAESLPSMHIEFDADVESEREMGGNSLQVRQLHHVIEDAAGDWLSLVFHASARGYVDVVQFLYDLGADINEAQKDDFWTPVHVASGYGHEAVVRLLHRLGADINAQDMDGRTPAHVATENGDMHLLRVLNEIGADVAILDDDGLAPLHITNLWDTTFAPMVPRHVLVG
jgi:hypothetical protein